MTHQEILQQQGAKLQSLLHKLKTKSEALEELVTKRQSLLDQTAAKLRSIKAEGLEAALEEQLKTVQALRVEKDQELQRQKTCKEELQLSRDRCGGHAQDYADNVSSLIYLSCVRML